MLQPHKNTSTTLSGGYRYSFNGMETDHEVSGHGNSYTTQFRQYDPRLGRWKSLDPLMAIYPSMSPFVAFNDNPVYFTDPLGLSSGGPGGKNPDEGGGEQGEVNGDQGEYVGHTKTGPRYEKDKEGTSPNQPNFENAPLRVSGVVNSEGAWREIHYNVATGQFEVTIHLTVVVENHSSVNSDELVSPLGNYYDPFMTPIEENVDNILTDGLTQTDEVRNISYTGDVTIDNENSSGSNLVLQITDAPGYNGGIAGVTLVGVCTEVNSNIDQYFQDRNHIFYTQWEIAATGVHEILHVFYVSHPFDDDNTAQDVDLYPTFDPTKGKHGKYVINTDEAEVFDNVMVNIMMYHFIFVNGISIEELYNGNTEDAVQISPDQLYIILQMIGIFIEVGH